MWQNFSYLQLDDFDRKHSEHYNSLEELNINAF